MVVAKRWRNRCDSGTPDVGTVEICGNLWNWTSDVLSLSPVLARVKSCRKHSKMKSCNAATTGLAGLGPVGLFTFCAVLLHVCQENACFSSSPSWTSATSSAFARFEPWRPLNLFCPFLGWEHRRSLQSICLIFGGRTFGFGLGCFFFLVCFERRNPEKTYKNYSENCRGCLFIKLPGRRASYAPNVVEQHLAKVAIFPSLSDLAPRFSEVLCFFPMFTCRDQQSDKPFRLPSSRSFWTMRTLIHAPLSWENEVCKTAGHKAFPMSGSNS